MDASTKKLTASHANAALWNNTYTTISTCFPSTGFRSPLLKYACQEIAYSLAEDFLINSFSKRDDAELVAPIYYYLSDSGVQTVSLIDQECLINQAVELPGSAELKLSLGAAIASRRSTRDYTSDAVSFSYLATILRAGNGISSIAEVNIAANEKAVFHLRTVASGGGLYPISLYVVALKVEGLESAIYRYQPIYDVLIPVLGNDALEHVLNSYVDAQELFKTSALLILLVGKPWRSIRKYGDKGLRFVLHETGAISQNIHLTVSALGLGSVDYAGYCEDELHKALKFNGVNTLVLHSIVIGVPGV